MESGDPDREIKLSILKAAEILQYSPLKEEQLKCIEEFLRGNDVFVVLPTGYGKTVCYACIPTAFDIYHKNPDGDSCIIIVVSPLTALIKDQVSSLTKRNINAGYIDAESQSQVKENIKNGIYSIVYMSPEIMVDKWRSMFENPIYKKRLAGIIVDEAHCVVKW